MATEAAPPPSYEISTSKQWLMHVAPYLYGQNLNLAIRVCKAWCRLLLPYLWGDPTRHFPTDPEDAQQAFLEFRQGLFRARFSTRSLVHTLRLPQAFARVDYQPNATWLRQILQGLPNLQSLVLPSTPFLDHEALVSLRQDAGIESLQNLRLLSLTYASNVTTAGLLELLKVPIRLLYVDLSGTRAARSSQVVAKLGALSELKVLKVSDLALGDEFAGSLFRAIGERVLHLDISKNNLTDLSVTPLGDKCFKDAFDPTRPPDGNGFAGMHPSLTNVENTDKHVYELLTASFNDGLILENRPDEGIRSLDISSNSLSYSAILSLVNCGSLQALDAGHCLGQQTSPGIQLLQPFSSRLRYLRVPHHLVTGVIVSRMHQVDQADLQPYLHTTLDTLEQVEAERQNRIQDFHGDGIVPASHPQLGALVMTSLPARTPNSQLSQALIRLIQDCAMEWRLACLQTRLDYRLPPGQRSTAVHLRREAQRLFALDEITLEIAPSKDAKATISSGWMHESDQMSMTGDADSEALWDAYASDFSFFGNERALNTEKGTSSLSRLPFDTVAEVAAFRKRVKGQYELATSRGEAMPKIDGYWEGKIKVVRP